MIQAANQFPSTLNTELSTKLREIIKEILKSISDRDEIHFQVAAKQKEAMLEYQKSQDSQQRMMMDNILNLKASVYDFQKSYTNQEKHNDTIMTILQKKEARAEQQIKENKEDIAQTQSQLNELVQGVNRLSADIRTLDADIKGEKEKGKGGDQGKGRRGQTIQERGRAPFHGQSSRSPPARQTQRSGQQAIVTAIPLSHQQATPSSYEVTKVNIRMPTGDPAFMRRHEENPVISRSELEELARNEEAQRKRRAEEHANPPPHKRPRKQR